MDRQSKWIGSFILGAGAMYLLDPDRGARRRSLVRDRLVHAGKKLGEGAAAAARDTRNRAVGAAAGLRSRFQADEVDDAVLHERVRAAIGRVVSHPGAVTVTAYDDGRVTLSGHVLAAEADELIRRVERVRGVREVRNELEMHRSSNGIPDLQGGGQPREERPELLQENWSPAVRLLTGIIGGGMALAGTRKGGRLGNVVGAAGMGLVTRAMTNLPASRLVGTGAGRRAIDIQKTIRVAAPVEAVWELWNNFEQFPRFMSHLREVRRQDENRSHWVAKGPAGIPVEWDAIVTERIPNERLAWKSVEGSAVQTAGRVRFRPTQDGGTEITVQMSYNPPAGALGHAVASLFGTDPKHAMDEDMVRLKSLLEEGKTSADGEEPVRLDQVISGSSDTSPTAGGHRPRH
jgi:uncharacterized membrane protein